MLRCHKQASLNALPAKDALRCQSTSIFRNFPCRGHAEAMSKVGPVDSSHSRVSARLLLEPCRIASELLAQLGSVTQSFICVKRRPCWKAGRSIDVIPRPALQELSRVVYHRDVNPCAALELFRSPHCMLNAGNQLEPMMLFTEEKYLGGSRQLTRTLLRDVWKEFSKS